MAKRLRVAVLASGRGSNLQALIDACADAAFPADIVCVIVNEPDAFAAERARNAGIAAIVVPHRDYDSREAFESALDHELRAAATELIVLAGFMRLLTADFVAAWPDRLVNIHPSLLPAFKGLDTHHRALDAGVCFTGCTVHFVRPDMDSGPIIVQAAVPILADDDEEALAARVLEQEHAIYPLAVRLIAEGRVSLGADDRVVIAGAMGPPPPPAVNLAS